jgi:hypothetical protein
MVINLASLPHETIDKYDLIELSQDGKVYIEIQKGIYGLPQAGILANELLQRNLAKDGYYPTTHKHGLWTHDIHPISLSLVVVLIPQVTPAHKYPISPWEMIHLPVGDNALCAPPYTIYLVVCNM